jgi:hypothetical protein
MSEKLYRAQLLLERKQHYELRRRAEQEGRSISDVAREVIQIGLDKACVDAGERQRLLEQLNDMRAGFLKHHGVYSGEPVADARSARASRLTEVQGTAGA